MATILFKDYYIDEFSYKENENFNFKTEKLDISPEFNAEVCVGKKDVLVNLFCRLGEEKKLECPFIASISMQGYFVYEVDKTSVEDIQLLKKLTSQNVIAILYPYLRTAVSEMILKTNRFPPYILPVANIVKLMEEGDKIKVVDLEED